MPVFTANIPGILKIGDRIEIGGKIKDNARKMSVNLCAQEGEEPRDVVLHFDARFHRDNIISLSRKNGVWIGSGNYDTNYNMFVPGTLFRILFEIKDIDVITIYCQGKFHSNFLPKIPLTMAKYLVAWADIERITHCYFHIHNKVGGDEPLAPPVYIPQSPRLAPGDGKRCQGQPRGKRMEVHTSNDSSEDDQPRPKCEGRADRYFYDTLMCHPPTGKFSPTNGKRGKLGKADYERFRGASNTEKESEDNTDASKNLDSSLLDSEEIQQDLGLKKRKGRKFSSFAQVVNFMGKNKRV